MVSVSPLHSGLTTLVANASGGRIDLEPGNRRDSSAGVTDDDTLRVLRGASLLVVDDDLGTRETFEWTLRPMGCRVWTASCAADAIQFAKSQPFDLLLVDLQLPDVSGTDMVRTLRETCAALAPFILMSAFLTTPFTVEAMRLGAVDILEKPISVDDLPRLVSSALRQSVSKVQDLHLQQAEPHAYLRLAYKAVEFIASPNDAPTLREFARAVGISVGGFRNWCRTARVPARAYLHLARALRAVYRREHNPAESLENLLQIIDRRTLEKFVIASGGTRAGMPLTVEELLTEQRLVGREAIAAIRAALRKATDAFGN